MMYRRTDLQVLLDKRILKIEGLRKESMQVDIYTECGKQYKFHHSQDCCEHVDLNDYEGNAESLKGAFITSVEEVGDNMTENMAKLLKGQHSNSGSCTWTFYKIETNKGGIWMRWLGESNGYYSEQVDFVEVI